MRSSEVGSKRGGTSEAHPLYGLHVDFTTNGPQRSTTGHRPLRSTAGLHRCMPRPLADAVATARHAQLACSPPLPRPPYSPCLSARPLLPSPPPFPTAALHAPIALPSPPTDARYFQQVTLLRQQRYRLPLFVPAAPPPFRCTTCARCTCWRPTSSAAWRRRRWRCDAAWPSRWPGTDSRCGGRRG